MGCCKCRLVQFGPSVVTQPWWSRVWNADGEMSRVSGKFRVWDSRSWLRSEGGDEDEATSDPLATRLSRGHLRVPSIAMRMQSLWFGCPHGGPKGDSPPANMLTIVSHCLGTTWYERTVQAQNPIVLVAVSVEFALDTFCFSTCTCRQGKVRKFEGIWTCGNEILVASQHDSAWYNITWTGGVFSRYFQDEGPANALIFWAGYCLMIVTRFGLVCQPNTNCGSFLPQ